MCFLLVLRLFLFLQEDESRSSRGVQDDLGQPIVAEFSDGVPPEGLGRLVQKEPTGLSCVSRFRLASHGASCRVSPSAPRVHVTCSCRAQFSVNTLFGDSAGEQALNGLQPVLATKRSLSSCCNLRR